MKILAQYEVESDEVPADVEIAQKDGEYINTYELRHVELEKPTSSVLDLLKEKIIEDVDIRLSEILEPREAENVRSKLVDKAKQIIKRELPGLSENYEKILVGRLAQDMLGLGEIELLLADANLEEVVVNGASGPVYVYHKKFGWLKTNVRIPSEDQIHNYASTIGRKVGKQITNLTPLMDARLLSGNRVNATLFPISFKGNGITIRKFRETPWTIVNFIDPQVRSLSPEVAALIWQAVQYELNVLVGGGTASGKTSFLNSILAFTPTNQRVISIEDTRELVLPDFLHWTPLVTREANPEGKGEVSMLDLMVNSLRMRPDRIVLGEIRRAREAEVLFEAMHTGHSVYSTVHADTAQQVKSRLTNPPIDLPEPEISAVHLVLVMYRQRRTGLRRLFEVSEFSESEGGRVPLNSLYQYNPRSDITEKVGESVRLFSELNLHTGFTNKEIIKDLNDKQAVLEWMQKQQVTNVNDVGKIVASYYRDPEDVVAMSLKNKKADELLGR
ncbi:MAG TPA: ATPase, T2SS/T4P/T4SS family [Candidatus Norongarragalinales archaeon]|jgi:flagellar protein FlaI|nr:ATPase, T2SS/T4P/T4SS family [Candidatus Norongarragalinales archaeon]